jgi:hypothetical protein
MIDNKTFLRNVGRGYAKLFVKLGNGEPLEALEDDTLSDFADDMRGLLEILDREIAKRDTNNGIL